MDVHKLRHGTSGLSSSLPITICRFQCIFIHAFRPEKVTQFMDSYNFILTFKFFATLFGCGWIETLIVKQ